jgi:thioredoxin 1
MKALKLDVDENPEVAAGYMLRSIPTLVLFSGGIERECVVGALPKPRLEAEVEQALTSAHSERQSA